MIANVPVLDILTCTAAGTITVTGRSLGPRLNVTVLAETRYFRDFDGAIRSFQGYEAYMEAGNDKPRKAGRAYLVVDDAGRFWMWPIDTGIAMVLTPWPEVGNRYELHVEVVTGGGYRFSKIFFNNLPARGVEEFEIPDAIVLFWDDFVA